MRPGWMRPSPTSRSMACRATSRRTGSKQERMTASGVSSTTTSTPVAASNERMFRPSRPMMRPFMSSLGRVTTETAASEEWSTDSFSIACEMILRASRSASPWARSRTSRTCCAASARAWSRISPTSSRRAASRSNPAISSSRRPSLRSRSSSPFIRVSSSPCSRSTASRRSSRRSCRWSRTSSFRSSVSLREIARCSWRSRSDRRRSASPAHASRSRCASSRPSSSAALRMLLASRRADSRMPRPSPSIRTRARRIPRRSMKTPATPPAMRPAITSRTVVAVMASNTARLRSRSIYVQKNRRNSAAGSRQKTSRPGLDAARRAP